MSSCVCRCGAHDSTLHSLGSSSLLISLPLVSMLCDQEVSKCLGWSRCSENLYWLNEWVVIASAAFGHRGSSLDGITLSNYLTENQMGLKFSDFSIH